MEGTKKIKVKRTLMHFLYGVKSISQAKEGDIRVLK